MTLNELRFAVFFLSCVQTNQPIYPKILCYSLNLVVDGIQTQFSDQPINDHKLTKIERLIIFMVFIT